MTFPCQNNANIYSREGGVALCILLLNRQGGEVEKTRKVLKRGIHVYKWLIKIIRDVEMVWNNNQQTHGAPGKIHPICVCEEEDLPRIHRDFPVYTSHAAEIQTT